MLNSVYSLVHNVALLCRLARMPESFNFPRKFRGNIPKKILSKETWRLRQDKYSKLGTKESMVGKINENLMMKMLEFIPEGGISVHQIACKTGWDHRTIKKYVQLIVQVQSAPKIKMESVGFRVLVRKEK